MREAYRKNKFLLYEHLSEKKLCVSLFLILRGNTIPDYPAVEKSVRDAIGKLIVLTGKE